MQLRSPPPLPPRNPTLTLPIPASTPEVASEVPVNGTPKPKPSSTESITNSNDTGSQRKRGHMKTLSLDRDFSLKTIRVELVPAVFQYFFSRIVPFSRRRVNQIH